MKKTAQGFTLVELLVVIAIIAVLAAVVVLVINPVELTKQSRDSVRLSDFATLQQAINASVQENTTDTAMDLYCVGHAATDTNCSANSWNNGSPARGIDGTGWVRIKLNTQNIVNLPVLPVDPGNSATSYYIYKGDANGYKLEAVLESTKQKPKMTQDGGTAADSNNYYEVGTNMSL